MKAVFFETKTGEQDFLLARLSGLEVSFYEEKLTLENLNLAQGAEILSVFINSELNADLLSQLSGLKLIATRSTGYDHIDLDFTKNKSIKVANVPGYGARTVAEFTFGLILNLSRKIYDAKHQILEREDFEIGQLEGFDLYGKTLGVIGTGRIGTNVIKIAKGFGLNVLAYDIKPDKSKAEELGFEYIDLDKLLASSDIISLHIPYFKETHHLINSSNIGQVKEGAYLINTARGELVETNALLSALKSGQLAGAGLDVLESERQLKEEAELISLTPEKIKDLKTLLQDHILINMPNVIITPHIAFFSKEAHQEILEITAENIKKFIADSPQNIVV